jgi:Holliday junction resolvasome RuvABC DNA-binding subunit
LGGPWLQALSALTALGFGQAQARAAVEAAHKQLGPEAVSLEDIVKAALKQV